MQPNFTQKTLADIKQVNISYNQLMCINHLVNQFLSERHFNDYDVDTDVGSTGYESVLNLDVYLQNTNIDNCLNLSDEFLDVLIDDETLDYGDYKNILVHFIPSQFKPKNIIQKTPTLPPDGGFIG